MPLGLHGEPVSFFSEDVPAILMERLLASSANPIFELELLLVLISQMLWFEWIRDAQVVCFLDNDGARHSLIKAGGGEELAMRIIDSCAHLENTAQLKAWHARVPTHSNLTDAPSRGHFQHLIAAGCSRLIVPWEEILKRTL